MTTKIRRYAEGTSVEVSRSRAAIEQLVVRHGATSFMSAFDKNRYVVIFELQRRRIRFDIAAPSTKEYQTTSKWAAEERRRWRALLLILKAKLELVQSGDADLDAEFLSYMVLPNGATVGSKVLPDLDRVISEGTLPPLLPGASQ